MPESASTNQSTLKRHPSGRIAGVCAGIAEYLNVDVYLVRTAAVVLCVLTLGLTGLLYLALWAMLPAADGVPAPRQVEVDASDYRSDYYGRLADTQAMPSSQGLSLPVYVALVVGVMAMVTGMCVLLASVTTIFEPLQFWPLAIVAAATMRMVLPDRCGRRAWPFLCGLALLMVGMVALLDSLGLVRMMWVRWLSGGWPLLAIAAALLFAGTRMKDRPAGPWLLVGGVAMVAAFMVFGFMLCLYPGYVQQVMIVLPGGEPVPFSL